MLESVVSWKSGCAVCTEVDNCRLSLYVVVTSPAVGSCAGIVTTPVDSTQCAGITRVKLWLDYMSHLKMSHVTSQDVKLTTISGPPLLHLSGGQAATTLVAKL